MSSDNENFPTYIFNTVFKCYCNTPELPSCFLCKDKSKRIGNWTLYEGEKPCTQHVPRTHITSQINISHWQYIHFEQTKNLISVHILQDRENNSIIKTQANHKKSYHTVVQSHYIFSNNRCLIMCFEPTLCSCLQTCQHRRYVRQRKKAHRKMHGVGRVSVAWLLLPLGWLTPALHRSLTCILHYTIVAWILTHRVNVSLFLSLTPAHHVVKKPFMFPYMDVNIFIISPPFYYY